MEDYRLPRIIINWNPPDRRRQPINLYMLGYKKLCNNDPERITGLGMGRQETVKGKK